MDVGASGVRERFAEFGEVVDADDVDDEAAAGAEAVVGVLRRCG